MSLPYEIPFADVRQALEKLLGTPLELIESVLFDLDEVTVTGVRTDENGKPCLTGTVTTRIPYKRDRDNR